MSREIWKMLGLGREAKKNTPQGGVEIMLKFEDAARENP
jgi:hypothetical protein